MFIKPIALSVGLALLPALTSHAITVKVTVSNNSPAGGVGLAPVWFGFHDGSFDSYDGGGAAAPALETLAEVGDPGPLSGVFGSDGTLVTTGSTQAGTRVQGNTGVLTPGASETRHWTWPRMDRINSSLRQHGPPSSDYFIANGNPLAHDVSSLLASGGALEFNIGLPGTINDAGTEINDFAFSAGNPISGIAGGDAPNGATEGGVISTVSGDPFAGFLSQPTGFNTGNLDFNDSGLYPNGIATVRVEAVQAQAVPEPGAALPIAALGLVTFLRRKRKS